jgi:hypothetical protein
MRKCMAVTAAMDMHPELDEKRLEVLRRPAWR